MKGVYSRSGEGLVERKFDGESRTHVQKFTEGGKQRWKRREDAGGKKECSLFEVGTEKINKTRIRADLPMDSQLDARDGADR